MDKRDLKNLKKRYLVWLYKNTKEAFDRYERKFTQLDIDKFMLAEMEKEVESSFMPAELEGVAKFIEDFRNYIEEKEKSCLELKYQDKKINPEFLFLDMKLRAVEKAIQSELGSKALDEIKELYQQEMLKRIMTEREEKR
ncbi:MAG: hypothetical protein FJZ09_01975 [Candidatus Omnitrophica bacterium]|nr:hypothetical protein [Candidatus Omnitrophota bacterium]